MSKLYYISPTTGEFKPLTSLLRGKQGIPGKDAYEVAVAEGFTGTRSEWLASLKADVGDDVNAIVNKELRKTFVSNSIIGTAEASMNNVIQCPQSANTGIIDMEITGYTNRGRDTTTEKATINNPSELIGSAYGASLTIVVSDGNTNETYTLSNLPASLYHVNDKYDRIFLDPEDNLWKYGSNVRSIKYGKDGEYTTYKGNESGSQYGEYGYRCIFKSPINVPAVRKKVESDMFSWYGTSTNCANQCFQYAESIYIYPEMTKDEFDIWLTENSFLILMERLSEYVTVLNDVNQTILNSIKTKFGTSTITFKSTLRDKARPKHIRVKYVKDTELYVENELSNFQPANSETRGYAKETVEDITWGWNLGNSLDCTMKLYASDANALTRIGTEDECSVYETKLGNPMTTKAMIDAVKAKGCNAVRIPITWAHHVYDDGKYTISSVWMDRVKEIVGYVLDNDMYCIINTHHDSSYSYNEEVGQGVLLLASWLDLNASKAENSTQILTKLWEQIAEEFKDYPVDKLIFEPFNEVVDRSANWAPATLSDYERYCDMVQAFVDTVRASGGNNHNRTLCIQTYASAESSLEYYFEPSDVVENAIIAQVHTYQPSIGQDFDLYLKTVTEAFDPLNIPVIIGEFGAKSSVIPLTLQPIYAKNIISRSRKYGVKCFCWDDGGTYQLLDRKNLTWVKEDFVNAMNTGLTEDVKDISYITEKVYTVDEFTYKKLSVEDDTAGTLVSDSYGYFTTTKALDVSGANFIDVNMEKADGYRIYSVIAYDENGECLLVDKLGSSQLKRKLYYDASDYASIRVCVFNPWGTKTEAQMKNAHNNEQIRLKIMTANI